jgi:hypothetical protein
MSSRRLTWLKILLMLFFTFQVAGCGQLFGEKPPKDVSPDAKLGFESECLEKVLPVMKDFMAGKGNAKAVSDTWFCFANGVKAFQRMVRGSSQNEYKAREEVVKFFEDYLLGGVKINDRLFIEIMHIKQIVIGGSVDSFTREELNKLQDFSYEMRRICLYLLPYMKVYSMNWSAGESSRIDESVRFFEEANLQLQVAAKDIAAIILRNDRGYRLGNVVILFEELQNLYHENWPWIAKIKAGLPLVEKLKSSLAGGDPQTVAANEWRRFALLGLRGYVQYLRYYYFIENGEGLTSSQLIYLTNSVDDLFSYLGDMVREKPTGVFSKIELLEVLQALKDIFPDLHISEGLVDEFMKIKSLFFGGSTELWTPDDFDKAKSKVTAFRAIAERFLNYADFYVYRWHPQDLSEGEAQNYFIGGESNLIESATIFGKIMESQYDLRDLEKFCNEFEKLFPPDDTGMHWPSTVKKYLPVLVSYKQLVLSDTGSVVMQGQWNALLVYTAKVFAQALYLNYFLQDDIFSGVGLNSLERFVKNSISIVSEIVERKPKPFTDKLRVIGYSDIDDLIDALSVSGVLPQGLKPATVKSTLRVALNKVLLSPADRLSGFLPGGLTVKASETLMTEFNVWAANQRLMEVLYQGVEGLSKEQILAGLQNANPDAAGIAEMKEVFASNTPLSMDDGERLFFRKTPENYKFNSVSAMNLSRLLARLIIRSYAMEKERIDNFTGVLESEVDTLYADWRAFIVEIGLVEPNNDAFAKNRYFEANLFTPNANGDSYVGLKEGTHLVLMILSGLQRNKFIEEQVQEHCPLQEGKERFDTYAQVSCVSKLYFHDTKNFLVSMDAAQEYVSLLSEAQFQAIFLDLLKATGWKDTHNGYASLSDLGLVPHIFQYIESIMVRYDTSKDGLLDDDETLAAYPTFQKLIKGISKTDSNIINKGIFFYMVKYGDVPDKFKDFVLLIKDIIRKAVFGKPIGIQSDRMKITKVFGAIADAIGKKSKTEKIKKLRFIIEQLVGREIEVDGKIYPLDSEGP